MKKEDEVKLALGIHTWLYLDPCGEGDLELTEIVSRRNVLAHRICSICKRMEFWDLSIWEELEEDDIGYSMKINLLEMLDEYNEKHRNKE